MTKRRVIGFGISICLVAIYAFNASWLAGAPDGEISLLAHRGVHQTFSPEGLKNDSCTAAIIDKPSHTYIENTLPSMQAALDAGATIIELDVHITTDGEFAVFHDWTLDCRTNGQGRVRDYSLVELKALDIGYGYTSDGGESFPFRGKFKGAMPSLNQVLDAFPKILFNINIKSRSAKEAQALADYLEQRSGSDWNRVIFNGHNTPLNVIKEYQPDVITFSKQSAKDCAKGYMITGWFGKLPESCHNTLIPVPSNYRRLIWGWPHRFEKRLQAVGSRSMLIGPLEGRATQGIDRLDQLSLIPEDYRGIVYTNKIEVIGPELATY